MASFQISVRWRLRAMQATTLKLYALLGAATIGRTHYAESGSDWMFPRLPVCGSAAGAPPRGASSWLAGNTAAVPDMSSRRVPSLQQVPAAFQWPFTPSAQAPVAGAEATV